MHLWLSDAVVNFDAWQQKGLGFQHAGRLQLFCAELAGYPRAFLWALQIFLVDGVNWLLQIAQGCESEWLLLCVLVLCTPWLLMQGQLDLLHHDT